MGNRHHKAEIPQYKEALHRFHGRELKDLKKTWKKLSHHSHGKLVDRVTFQEHFLEDKHSHYHLPKTLADHLFNAFDERHEDKIDYQEFIIGTAMCCKGSIEEKLQFCFHVIANAEGTDEPHVNKEDLFSLFSVVVSAVHSLLGGEGTEVDKCSEALRALVDCAFSNSEDVLHWEEFKNWATTNPVVWEYLEVLVHKGWAPKFSQEIPLLPTPPPPPPKFLFDNKEFPSTLISPEVVVKLRDSFEEKYWDSDFALLYTPEMHGYGLSNLYSRVSGNNPLLLVLKDDKGNIFGAFCSEQLKHFSGYYGSRSTFLFTLSPKFEKFYPPLCGGNDSFILCTPNSLTFGGPQPGLTLDREIDKGQTFPCPTFGSPPLTEENFSCLAMEVWSVKSREVPTVKTPLMQKSSLRPESAPSSPLGSSEDLRRLEESKMQLAQEKQELQSQLESVQKELEKEKRIREELEEKLTPTLSPKEKRKKRKQKKTKESDALSE